MYVQGLGRAEADLTVALNTGARFEPARRAEALGLRALARLSLGRAAEVSASKMRYQMNRLRRMSATFELQKEASLRKHADALTLNLFPEGHPQERVIAGAWFLAADENLIARLVEEAANQCPGHIVIRL